MYTTGEELEIKPSQKNKVFNILGFLFGLGIIMFILTVKLSGFWMWFWDVLLGGFSVFMVYYYLNLPVIKIGKEGIYEGKKLMEWRWIQRAYLIRYITQKHRVYYRLNVEVFDERGSVHENSIDVTDYVYSWGDVERAISYWSSGQLEDSPERSFNKAMAANPLLELFCEEQNREWNIFKGASIVIFVLLMIFSCTWLEMLPEENRGFVTLVVCLVMGVCMCVSWAITSVLMMMVQLSFLSKPSIKSLSRDERDALVEQAKAHEKSSLVDWGKQLWMPILGIVVLSLAVWGSLYWHGF